MWIRNQDKTKLYKAECIEYYDNQLKIMEKDLEELKEYES